MPTRPPPTPPNLSGKQICCARACATAPRVAVRFPGSTSAADGAALYSLRPEAIQLAVASSGIADLVRFRAVIRQQIYAGASELLEIDCGDGQVLRARIPARGSLSGEQEFAFSADDAIRVAE